MLYNKAHFAARHAVSTDSTRFNLNGVHFRSDGTTEATDGHILIRVDAKTPSSDDFPHMPNGTPQPAGEPLKSFILPTDCVNRAVKAIPKGIQVKRMPVLGHVLLDVAATNENGSAKFIATDLESVSVVEGKKIECDYPDTAQVTPKVAADQKPTFIINLKHMERIIKAVKEFKGTGADHLAAEFNVDIDNAFAPILIRVSDPDVGELEAVIMPMRT